MANEVRNLIDDVGSRIGDSEHNLISPIIKLRSMNHIYHSLNEELRCLEKTLDLAAGTFSDTVESYTLPDDWIEPYNLEPGDEDNLYQNIVYVPKELWNPTQYNYHNVFTIDNGVIKFANVDADSAFSIPYYSSGLELVDAADGDVVANETTNTPAWKTRFWRALVYWTCIDISAVYPMRQNDLIEGNKLKTQLQKHNKNRQSVTPAIIGGLAPNYKKSDPDWVDGMKVTKTCGY